MMKRFGVLLVSFLTLLGTPAPASGNVTAEELQSVIGKAKIFGPEARLTATRTSTELVVSTYKNAGEGDKDDKINAILTAKAAFAADPQLARVTVLFYDPDDATRYSEISVTVGDVAAFGSGQISQSQLLAALKVTTHSNATIMTFGNVSPVSSTAQPAPTSRSNVASTVDGSSAPAKPASSSESSSTASVAALTGSAPHAAPTVAQKRGLSTYSNYGVTLNYPPDWRLAHPHTANIIATFTIRESTAQPAIVDVLVYSLANVSPQELTEMEPEPMFRHGWDLAWVDSQPDEVKPGLLEKLQKMHEREDIARERDRRQQQEYAPSQPNGWMQHRRGQEERGEEHHFHAYKRFGAVALPQTVKVGANKGITAYQRAYWATAPLSPKEYMRYVAFKSSNFVVQLCLTASEKDASTASTQFDQMLSQMSVASASTGAQLQKKSPGTPSKRK